MVSSEWQSWVWECSRFTESVEISWNDLCPKWHLTNLMLSVPSVRSHLRMDAHWWGTPTRHSCLPITGARIWNTLRCKQKFAVGEQMHGLISSHGGSWCSLTCWRGSLNSILYTHELLRRQKDPGETSQPEHDLTGGCWHVIEFWPATHHLDLAERTKHGKQRKKQVPAVILGNQCPCCLQLPHCETTPAAPHPFLSLCHSPSQKCSARLTLMTPALCTLQKCWDSPCFQETSPLTCNYAETIPPMAPYTLTKIYRP